MTAVLPSVPESPSSQDVARKQIRGSTLLLFGRGCSLLLNLIAQVITVRYLTKLDYGVFAWAFAITESAALVSQLGLDKAVMRFAAIYHEQGDQRRLAGTLLLAFGTALGLGTIFGIILFASQTLLADSFAVGEQAIGILILLLCLIPISAFSSVTFAFLNVVRGAKAMLFRKHLASPLLKLPAVIAVVICGGTLQEMALAYLFIGVCGLLLDVSILVKVMREDGIRLFHKREVIVPAKELLGFSVPMLSSDLMFLVRNSLIVILAGWLAGPVASAELRTIVPLVRMNELVLMNFALLFIPLASRLLAGNRMTELERVAQKSSAWVMVMCFPIFASCVLLSRPLLGLLFGTQYQQAASSLIVLTGAYFLDAILGFSSRVLKVLGLVRVVVIQDIVSVIVALAVGYVLIPRYGTVGAAIAVASSIIMLDGLRMLTLYRRTEIRLFRPEFLKPLLTTLGAGIGIVALRSAWEPGLVWGTLLAVAVSAFVVFVNRDTLQVDETFPELRRLAFLKRWITR